MSRPDAKASRRGVSKLRIQRGTYAPGRALSDAGLRHPTSPARPATVARCAALESVTAVPSLKATSIAFVLRSASQYDDHSKDAIAELLASHFVKECCDALQSPANFSGAAHLPALLDACRASLVARPAAAARVLSALYTACTLKESEVNWTAAIAAADRLLCIGLFKREITGPTLPRPLADSVRRLRKLLQKRDAAPRGRRAAVRFDEPSQQWALRAYRLRELDRYSG